jgi:ABC-type polysaccharide/polyol phosphate export permease
VNGPPAYYWAPLGLLGTIAFSLILLIVGYRTFYRLEGRFVEFI